MINGPVPQETSGLTYNEIVSPGASRLQVKAGRCGQRGKRASLLQ